MTQEMQALYDTLEQERTDIFDVVDSYDLNPCDTSIYQNHGQFQNEKYRECKKINNQIF